MKFLVDAQLPRRFATWLNEAGHETLHTLDLPKKNHTPDSELIALAMQEGSIVVSKDADFVQSLWLQVSRRCC
jgi:predicted nuclease of predicted toxin-antitoxin system